MHLCLSYLCAKHPHSSWFNPEPTPVPVTRHFTRSIQLSPIPDIRVKARRLHSLDLFTAQPRLEYLHTQPAFQRRRSVRIPRRSLRDPAELVLHGRV